MQMSDMTNVYRRLGLKQSGRINYIDFYNQVYLHRSLGGFNEEEERLAAMKSTKMKKKFIKMIDQD